jgi:hypothetical protein
MSLLFSLLPAVLLGALGYVVLYCSAKADGAVMKKFGQVLAVLLLIFAAFPVLVGAYLTSAGISPGDLMAQHMSSMQR